MPRSSSKLRSAASLQAHLHVERPALGHRRDVGVRLEDLDVAVGDDVPRLHLAGLVHLDVQRLGGVGVKLQRDLLQVENDVGRILDHAGDRRELVHDAVDSDGGDGRALNRGEQHATHRVADGRAESPLERLGMEPAEPIRQRLAIELQPFGTLETFPQHRSVLSCTFGYVSAARRPVHPWAASGVHPVTSSTTRRSAAH
jgi:hypothetical protein